MDNLKQALNELEERLNSVETKLDKDAMVQEIRELEAKTMKENFWSDGENAQRVMREMTELQKTLEEMENLEKEISDLKGLRELFAHDDEIDNDETQLASEVKKVGKKIEELESRIFLNGKYDGNDVILSIHAGQGGTEAMDWAAMLLRMYMRFSERKGWVVEIMEESQGEVGYKSVVMTVKGTNAYGYLKHEAGTHRLVRQSPFNADNLRQTSFALVEVLPYLPENSEITVSKEEIEFEAFRSGGHGGQNVNKVSTAVRIKHIPTGIVVTCQTQRSQEQNRKAAMALLTAKLWEREMAAQAELTSELKGKYQPAAWGTQIRSYVLHPYKMVKDLRTEVESNQPDEVLDGDLDRFIEAEIRSLG